LAKYGFEKQVVQHTSMYHTYHKLPWSLAF